MLDRVPTVEQLLDEVTVAQPAAAPGRLEGVRRDDDQAEGSDACDARILAVAHRPILWPRVAADVLD